MKEKEKPVIELKGSRRPRADTRVLLFTRAGGRCEFDNCNRYLLSHHVTHVDGNFAQMAHIVAFSPDGPRGRAELTAEERNEIENLMLLCGSCHKLIDDNPDVYSTKTLRGFKRDHEARIQMLTGTKADRQTVPLVLKATIGKSPVAVPLADMQAAVSPFYIDPKEVDSIDLTSGPETRTEAYWRSGAETIGHCDQAFYARLRNCDRHHVSVFALAPIPLLVFLGSSLSNKYPIALFQRHRDTEDWTWKDEGDVVEFECRVRRNGQDPEKVGLVLSVSGVVPEADYQASLDAGFTVYEVVPREVTPSFDILSVRETLEAFRSEYRATLQRIVATHPSATEVHVFPAVPAPIAVAAGLDWMNKTHPALVIYDKAGVDGFQRAMDIRYD